MSKFISGTLQLCALSIALFCACQKDEVDNSAKVEERIPASSTVSAYTATVRGGFHQKLSFDELTYGAIGFYYSSDAGADKLFDDWLAGKSITDVNSEYNWTQVEGLYQAKIKNLKPNTTYFFCLFLESESGKRYIGSRGSFTTLDYKPVVTTGDMESVGYFDAKIAGCISVGQDNLDISEAGIVVSVNRDDVTTKGKKTVANACKDGEYFTLNVTGLADEQEYYYRTYLISPDGQTYYGSISSFKTRKMAVDLGFGTLWAACNIGADEPEEYGSYYAWGEISTKDTYNFSTYKFQTQKTNKYNTDTTSANVSSLLYIEPADDAAHVNWGGDWHIPSVDEWDELFNYCYRDFVTQNNVMGIRFTSKVNNESIFIPFSGIRYEKELRGDGSIVAFFERDLWFCAGAYGYWYVYWYNDDSAFNVPRDLCRWHGLTIRPVRSK